MAQPGTPKSHLYDADLDNSEIERILRAMWRNLGRVIGEYPHINAIVKERVG